jgi:glyoxylase-like metal-dependent hydrolase (beta-lactamase superfamily II)
MQIKVFQFNPVGVNTYIMWDGSGEGVIIDMGCCNEGEFETLFSFIDREKITVKHLLITHPHFDHIYGANGCIKRYGLPLELHAKAVPLMDEAVHTAQVLGFPFEDELSPDKMQTFEEGDIITFGNSALEIFYTPGHCEGSVSFVERSSRTVFTGDVLFRDSIGRTDFPTGDYDLLRSSIYNKLFTLDESDCSRSSVSDNSGNTTDTVPSYTVRPGHGGRTTIEYERYHNPFL